MKLADNIENLIRDSRILDTNTNTQMDQKIIHDALNVQEKLKKTKSAETQPITWRKIMNSKITKSAAAAVIIIAAGFLATVLNKSVAQAYAIEQTIEAFKKVDSVYVEEIIRDKGTLVNAKMWARRGSHGKFFFGDFRQESGNNGYTIVANESENRTYYYDPSAKRVRIYDRLNVTIGNFLDKDYFLDLQQEMENVELEYDKDKITGKEIVILKYKVQIPGRYDKSVAKSEVITFDLETKLPIRWTSWDNPDFKGEPFLEWTLIEYNPELPENTFKFEIPEDATVIRE